MAMQNKDEKSKEPSVSALVVRYNSVKPVATALQLGPSATRQML